MTTPKYYIKKRFSRRRQSKGGGNCISSGSCYFPEEEIVVNTEPMTPTEKLARAVERNDLEKVKEAVNEGASINGEISTPAHETPLLSAIYNNNVDIVKYLLSQKNTDINIVRYAHGRTPVNPVSFATLYNRKAILELLLRKGAKIVPRYVMHNSSNLLPDLQNQIKREKGIVSELSAKKKMFPGFSEMTRAYVTLAPESAANKVFAGIKNNNLNAVKNAIETKIANEGVTDPIMRNKQFNEFIVSRDSNGDTFLIAAARTGNVEIVKYLLSIMDRDVITTLNNIYLNGENPKTAETALMVAATLGYMDIVNMLLDKDTRLHDGEDRFPLAVVKAASPNVSTEIFKYLLEQGPARTGLTGEYVHWMLNAYNNLSAEKKTLLEQYARVNNLNISPRNPPRTGGKSRTKRRRLGKKKMSRKVARKARK